MNVLLMPIVLERKNVVSMIVVGSLAYQVKFIYSEKVTKFSEIFSLLLTTVHTIKSKGKISQNLVAFSEYMKTIGTNQIKDKTSLVNRKYSSLHLLFLPNFPGPRFISCPMSIPEFRLLKTTEKSNKLNY